MNFNQIATTLKNLKPAATIITPSNHGCGLTNNIIKFVAEEWNITPIPVMVYDVLTIKEICGKFNNNPVCLIIEEFNKQPLITRKFIINSLIGGEDVLPVGSKIILINDCDNPLMLVLAVSPVRLMFMDKFSIVVAAMFSPAFCVLTMLLGKPPIQCH